jgi:hypothetical protein
VWEEGREKNETQILHRCFSDDDQGKQNLSLLAEIRKLSDQPYTVRYSGLYSASRRYSLVQLTVGRF